VFPHETPAATAQGFSATYRKLQLLLPKDRVTESFIMQLQLPQLKASSAKSRKLQLLLPKDRVTECFIMKLQLPQFKNYSASSTLQSDVALFSSTCYFHLVWQKILTKKRQLCPRMIVIKFLLIQPKNNL